MVEIVSINKLHLNENINKICIVCMYIRQCTRKKNYRSVDNQFSKHEEGIIKSTKIK